MKKVPKILAGLVILVVTIWIIELISISRSMSMPVEDATPCFTTGNHSTEGSDCAQVIVIEVNGAKETVLVQAYNFTEPRIIKALVDAKNRGVKVLVLVDKISSSQKHEGVDTVFNAGIQTGVDNIPKIAHNKVMIIDNKTVLTGSFNFSTNANCCNAENLLVLRSVELAGSYTENFYRRWMVAKLYMPLVVPK